MKLNASCNVIESNIVNCKMQIVSRGEESNEKKVKKNCLRKLGVDLWGATLFGGYTLIRIA